MGDHNQSLRTNYTPAPALKRRAQQSIRRGDKYVSSTGILTVKYHPSFDDFAARVAHELRHKIVYRTDGGHIARGLVRASGDLELLHRALWGGRTPIGGTVRLEAHFYRRKDPLAPNRWMMSIRFKSPDWIFEDEGDVVTPDALRMEQLRCTAMDKIVSCAALHAADIPGEPGKRIRKMVEIADRLDCQAASQLWYYNRAAAFEYFTWRTTDTRRKEMTTKSGGKMPFDGSVHPHGEWRIFPFKTISQKYGTLAQCSGAIRTELVFADEQIFKSMDDIQRELGRAGPLLAELNKLHKGGSAMYGLAEPFLEHLIKLQGSSDHLYSAYK